MPPENVRGTENDASHCTIKKIIINLKISEIYFFASKTRAFIFHTVLILIISNSWTN